jgi:hypothetical protein
MLKTHPKGLFLRVILANLLLKVNAFESIDDMLFEFKFSVIILVNKLKYSAVMIALFILNENQFLF